MLLAPLTCGKHHPGPSEQIRAYGGGPEKPLQSVDQGKHGQDIGKIAAGQVLIEAREGAMHLLPTQQVRQIHRYGGQDTTQSESAKHKIERIVLPTIQTQRNAWEEHQVHDIIHDEIKLCTKG